jgi:hypothetical protein
VPLSLSKWRIEGCWLGAAVLRHGDFDTLSPHSARPVTIKASL